MDQHRTSPLQAVHERAGAVFTDFAGWRMPVRYSSDLAEHRAVREAAGIFDLSHMGEIEIAGNQAGMALDHALAGVFSTMSVGRAKYSLLLTDRGGILDDLVTYRLDENRFLAVANAANALADLEALTDRAAGFDARVTDRGADTALIAVQGPASQGILTAALAGDTMGISVDQIRELGYYRVLTGTFDGAEVLVARTGYTGEDGFELYVPARNAQALWERLEEAGAGTLVPCGLACRDTLRLEAGMPLYGHELGTEILPAQAGLGRLSALGGERDFVGRAALESTDVSGRRVLVGLAGRGRRAARAGSALKDDAGRAIGTVTSGALSPTLGHPIAMAFVDPGAAGQGSVLVADVRGTDLPMTVVPLPFYARS